MAKEKAKKSKKAKKKDKKSKKSKPSPDQKRTKKSKEAKVQKDRRNDEIDEINTDAQASQGVKQLQTIARGGQSDAAKPCHAETSISIPINLSVNVASNDSSVGGGWSWGTAFAVASKVQPNEADLDGNFLKAAAASDAARGGSEGVMDISQLANSHETQVALSNDAEESNHGSSEKKMKRQRSESSGAGSDDDDEGSAASKASDDQSLEGRMVSISSDQENGDMALVLVHKQSGQVYSSGERTHDGRRLVIGKVVKGKVELDRSAIVEMKQLEDGSNLSEQSAQGAATPGPSFPYETNPDDHCETPLQSYKDILPILNELCKSFGGEKRSMKIYDPYFCDGSVVKHLSSLGFSSIHNVKEDCYAVWKSNSEPSFDVFLTNPPYSEDHIEKLMRHVTSSSFGNKPWLLLMPQWVHKKDYYINATTKNSTKRRDPFYIVPKRRYVYVPPANFREKKESDTHKKSSPFVSMWFCWGGTDKRNNELINAFQKSPVVNECDLARSKSALRDLRRSGGGGKGRKKKKARTGK